MPDAPTLPASPVMSRQRQLRVVVIAGGALVVLWLLLTGVHRLLTPAAPPEAAPPAGSFRATPAQLAGMRIEAVRAGSAAGIVQATGTISVDEERSTPVVLPFSGQVTDVLVEAGQAVAKGQPLLRIASADYNTARNALAAAVAARQTAAAQLKIAEDNAARQQAIYQTAGGALKDYRQAQSDLVAARAQAATATSAAATARGQLALLGGAKGSSALATYAAPVSGVIVARNVAPGQYVGAGSTDKPLLVIADLSTVWLVAQLAESDAALVKVGDPVTVTTPAYPNRSFKATIDNIGAALDPATHRLPVRASVANPGAMLKPQMFASFAISRIAGGSSTAGGVLVPSQAVIHEGDTARVWLSLGGGLLRAQPVTVGDSANGFDTVTSGLRPGERIVTSGALFVNQAGLGG